MTRMNGVWAMVVAIGMAATTGFGAEEAGGATYTVTLDAAQNGSFTVVPVLPEGGKVKAGTELTVKAAPGAGFAVDCVYWMGTGNQGRMYYETAAAETKIKIDGNKRIGASFIAEKEVEGIVVKNDVVFAKPGVKELKYDVFSPSGAKNLPCVVIIHGGGWSVNNEDVMRGLARELVRGGKYVAVSVDYRWIRNGDGDTTPVTMANIIEDVFGAIAHVQEHAAEYGADPTRIAVTGDSAGGHLSAVAANMCDKIGDGGFGVKEGVYEFKPTYMPKGKTVEQVRKDIVGAIKAAVPSYGVFSEQGLGRNGGTGAALKAISPRSNVPNVKDRAVPTYMLRGTVDNTVSDAEVQGYTDALKAAGQRVEYVKVEGASHAFLDWKPDARTKATFYKYGVPYAAKMGEFFDSVFYKKE